jgi:hypothetical protein
VLAFASNFAPASNFNLRGAAKWRLELFWPKFNFSDHYSR